MFTAVNSRHLLFLPGAGGDPRFWRPLGDLLPADWRKTYLGWPGLGDQPADPRVRGFDDLIALAETHLGAEPVDILAQSMGGVVALHLALRRPNQVRRLVLAATSGGVDVARFGATDWRPEYREAFPNAAAWIERPAPDLTPALSRIGAPTLLLWADADPISPAAIGHHLRSLLPHATLHLIATDDHGFVSTRPAEIAPLVCRHLEVT